MKLKLAFSIVLVIILALSVNVMGTRADLLDPGCHITGYSVTYDGGSHTATGSCDASGTLDLSGTTHTDAGDYSDGWTFTPDDPGTYSGAGDQVSDSIAQAGSGCSISGYNATYNGSDHTASGSCSAPGSLDLSGTTHNDAGSWSDTWSFTAGSANYSNDGGQVSDSIAQASSGCHITGYSVTYNGSDHTASGSCTASGSLDLSGTTHNGAGSWTDPWSFTAGSANYESIPNGTVSDSIAQADPGCSVTGYTATYDGNDHTATGTCAVSGTLDLSGTTHNGAGSWTDPWTFTEPTGNYKAIPDGTVSDSIAQADPGCSVTGYSVTYDGSGHTASGSCAASGTLVLSGTAHTNAGSWTDSWSFTAGSANYSNDGGSVSDSIAQADPACHVAGYGVTYNHSPHTASGSCAVSGLDLSGTTHTGAGSWTDTWNFHDGTGNYKDDSGTANDNIDKADPDCSSLYASDASFDGTYDGNAHPSGTCTGVGGEDVSGSLSWLMPPVTDVPGGFVRWSFTNSNYNHKEEIWNIIIGPAEPNCTVTGYSVTYNGNPHTATGSCKGVKNEGLSSLDLSGTTHTLPGDYSGDAWTFTFTSIPKNYNGTSGTVNDNIDKAEATCSISGWTGTYDGAPHGASGSCIGPGVNPNDLNLGSTFTEPGTYTANWSFTDTTGYFKDQSGSMPIIINKIPTTTTVTCTGGPFTYTGSAQTPCTGVVRGADGFVFPTPTLTYHNNTNAGLATATYTFPGNAHYAASNNGSASFTINQATAVVTVTCPASVTYTGSAQTPCTAHYSTTDGLTGPLTPTYSNNINVGTATASATYAGDANHQTKTNTATFQITQAPAHVVVSCPASVPYTGSAQQPCTATVTGVTNPALTWTCTSDCTHQGTANVRADFAGNTNVAAGFGTGSFTIAAPALICTVTGYHVTYDGAAHTATGTCRTTDGVDYTSNLNLSGTTHTNAGTYSDTWTFTASGPYLARSGPVSDSIAKANANCDASGLTFYSGVYTGTPHAVATHCYDINNNAFPGSQITYSGNTTNVGINIVQWHFTDVTGNYNNQSGWGLVIITAADSSTTVHCTITGWSGAYDGLAHGASGTCTGINNEDLTASLNLGAKFTNVPGGTANWTFSNPNYTPNQSGPVSIVITRILSSVTVSCPAIVPYTGSAQTPCTASYSTTDGLHGSLPVTYSNNVNAGTATASATYVGDANHATSTNLAHFEIQEVTSTVTVSCPASVPYTGSAQTPCTASYSTTDGLSGPLNVTYSNNLNAGTATASATYAGDANRQGSNGSANFTISTLDANCSVTGYAVAYNGSPHTATGACTGMGGASVSGLDLSGTTHTDAGDYTDGWTFSDVNGNYNTINRTVADSIAKANATCIISGYTVTYDGSAHTAAGYCTGIMGVTLSGLDLSATTHTEAGDYPGEAWTFTDVTKNYKDASGAVNDSIAKANAICTVTPYAVTYDGNIHTDAGSCTGVGGVTLSGLDLSATTHTNAGDYPGDAWTFTDANGNYYNLNRTVHDSIAMVDAICTVTPYAVSYNGSSHTDAGSCTGIGGVTLGGLDLSFTTHTNAGDYVNDSWTFTDANGNYHNLNRTVHDSIAKVDATCKVTGYSGSYDGATHGAKGSCTGVGGVTVNGLNLGSAFDHVPGGTAHWTFTGGTNYNDQPGGDVAITIDKAPSITTVTCPFSVPYTGSPLEPCTAVATGAGALNQTLPVYYTSNTDIGTAEADSTYTGDDNHTGSTGYKNFTITAAGVPGVPGAGGVEAPTAAVTPTSTPGHKTDNAVGLDVKAAVLANEVQVPPAQPTLTTLPGSGGGQAAAAAAAPAAEAATGGKSKSPNWLATHSGLFGWIGAGFLGLLIFFMTKRRREADEEETSQKDIKRNLQ